MERGTYVAASDGVQKLLELEVINNNLANANSAGFKRQFVQTEERAFDQTLASMMNLKDPYAKPDHDRTPEVKVKGTHTDFSPGPIATTGNPLDVALRHPHDFFVISAPQGVYYTRAGNFTLNTEGELVTPDGAQVQGDGGAISAVGAGVHLAEDGSVIGNGTALGRLQVVRFEDPSVLERLEGTRFRLKAGATAGTQVDPNLVTRSLEMPNVSVVTSMVEMVAASRGFELYTKTARTIDELNQVAIQQVGRAIR
ncbi:MAG: flagellar hook-basal body protein [Deltaproteobacteria bacterium]|nr:flagellar hook-basal body protein [Deltaproteobacteria bacterium]